MELLKETNIQQKKAITHEVGPQLIVAGAGTGKTRVITTRVAWLILEKKLKMDEILALTFTEKASREMEERVEQLLPIGSFDLWISTFHAFCDKLLKRHALEIGKADNYKLIDETEAWLLIRKNLDRFDLDYYRPLGNPAKFIRALLKHFSRCKDEGISPDKYLDYAEEVKLNSDSLEFVKNLDLDSLSAKEQTALKKQEILRLEEVAKAYKIYQTLLAENNCLDFGDLLTDTIRLFKERPLILARYRQQFKYILVDEFQDTNLVQYELIKMLAAPNNNITVVGDDDQSIYKFRGASISNIMQFKEDYPQAQEVVLTDNYRSGQAILDLAYKFIIQNNPYRLEEKLGVNKKLKSHVSEAAAVEHIHEKNQEGEAQAVIRTILSLRKEKQASWSDFAILTRANDSAGLFCGYLEQAGIPFQFLAQRGLYRKPVIIDLINYLKLLDNYHEGPAVYRVLNFPNWKLSCAVIVKLAHWAKQKNLSLFERLKQAATIPGLDKDSVALLDKIRSQVEKDTRLCQTKKPSEVLLDFLYHSGYLTELQKGVEAVVKENLNYLQQFFRKLQDFEASQEDPRLKDFLSLLQMEQEAGESGRLAFDLETGPELVKVLTIHSAKGLEFDYVFLPHLVDRKFPTDERQEAIEIPTALIPEKLPEGDFHLAEERRLFYVAMTRAKKGLFFSSADNYGGARDRKLSRFLLELGFAKKETEAAADEKTLFKLDSPQSSAAAERLSVLPKQFSFSQMQTYEICPLRYKFAYILNIPTFGNAHFTFGTVIHAVLQKFLSLIAIGEQSDLFSSKKSATKVPAFSKLLEIYQQNWSSDWYENTNQEQEYFKRGKQLLQNFYDHFIQEKPRVKYLERSFKIKLGQYLFGGKIDRVDEADGGLVIVDYKTGNAPANRQLTPEDKRQLLFYQIVAEEWPETQVKNLQYFYLKDNCLLDFVGNENDKEKLKKRFLANIEAIKAQRFEPAPNPHICQYCSFKDICEEKKL